MEAFIAIILLFAIYFLPALIGAGRKHKNSTAIFVLNLTLGWTLFGWIAALVWSFTNSGTQAVAHVDTSPTPTDKRPGIAEELERLQALREKGAISEEEFLRLKSKAISST